MVFGMVSDVGCDLSVYGFLPRTALAIAETIRRTRNTKNRICAIPEAAPAMPPNPRTPATTARTRKSSAQDNMILVFLN